MLDVGVDDLEPVVLATFPHRIIGAVDDVGIVERAEGTGHGPALAIGRAPLGAVPAAWYANHAEA